MGIATTHLEANMKIRFCPQPFALSACSILVIIAMALVGCAHISFHDPRDSKRANVGVEYYKPKLYLLVTQQKEGYKADILTLPDLAQPRYAVLHPGYGSSSLSLKLNNGILTDVGQTVDTKIPETITALGSLATAAGGFAKLIERAGAREQEQPFRLFEIIMRQGELRLEEVKVYVRSS
jgi:hypothetical protein